MTGTTDLSYASATELLALLRSRALSPVELMNHTLDRIDTHDGVLNSVVRLDAERALAEAADAAGRIARDEPGLGPLTGLPVLVKDGEDVAGLPTSHGTRAFRDNPPAERDSLHVARLRVAGAIIIGKTNMPPMGAGVHTANEAFGTSRNPWNTALSPGGSSGGSAAAVAAGLVALATAGDGGGSTRIPAALCGTVGLKPSRGRIPQGPARSTHWPRNTVLGCVTRTVRDTALHLDVAAGHHPADPFSLPAPAVPYLDALDRPAEGLREIRIRVMRTFGVARPAPEQLAALERTVSTLWDLGFRVVEADAPLPGADDFTSLIQLRQKVLARARLTGALDTFTTRPQDFEPWFAAALDQGRSVTIEELARYWEHRARLDRWAAGLFTDHDLLLTPTVPTTAWPAEGPDIETAIRERTVPIAYTCVFNDTGHPALTVPVAPADGSAGLPLAVQLVAPHHREDLLLGVGALLEAAGRARHPVL
ncbi:amidase [Kitasatospora sp. NPDC008115]|uniref:amidase n=1 Tax=Kitasatospora sp. NPDC008115 TaxID=3364022 RepID=UPI0036E315F8